MEGRAAVKRLIVVLALGLCLLPITASGGSAGADTVVLPDPEGTGISLTIDGTPVSLFADREGPGSQCFPSGFASGQLAHLSGPLTVTISGFPADTTAFELDVGARVTDEVPISGIVFRGTLDPAEHVTSIVRTVPNSGMNSQLRCVDGEHSELPFVLSMDDDDGNLTIVVVDLTLADVD
jgi:hypothetical protein